MTANLIFRLLQAVDAQDSSWNYSPQLDRFLPNPDDVILFETYSTLTEGRNNNVIIGLQLKFCSKQDLSILKSFIQQGGKVFLFPSLLIQECISC